MMCSECLNGTHNCFVEFDVDSGGRLSNDSLEKLKRDLIQVFNFQYHNKDHEIFDIKFIYMHPIEGKTTLLITVTNTKQSVVWFQAHTNLSVFVYKKLLNIAFFLQSLKIRKTSSWSGNLATTITMKTNISITLKRTSSSHNCWACLDHATSTLSTSKNFLMKMVMTRSLWQSGKTSSTYQVRFIYAYSYTKLSWNAYYSLIIILTDPAHTSIIAAI